MPDLVDTTALHRAVQRLADAVQTIATQVGDVPEVRRLRNDVERIELDVSDCTQLRPSAPVRQLETISDAPYDQSLWEGADDEGLGGFHAPRTPPHVPRNHHGHR